MEIVRAIQQKFEKNLFKGKVIIIYGARSVGKTTLSKQIIKNYPKAKIKVQKEFLETYPESEFRTINNNNY